MAEALAGELDNARTLAQDKKQASEGLQAQAANQVKKLVVKNTKRLILRIISASFAFTGIGLIVAWFVMSFRLVAGNFYHMIEEIVLEGRELIWWGVLTIVLLVVFALLSLLLIIQSDPVEFIWAGLTDLIGI